LRMRARRPLTVARISAGVVLVDMLGLTNEDEHVPVAEVDDVAAVGKVEGEHVAVLVVS